MALQTQPDFETALSRIEAWWHRQLIDRPPVTLAVRPERPVHRPPLPSNDPRECWLDIRYAVECAAAAVEAGTYLAENFPRYDPCDNPEVAGTVFGARLVFTPSGHYAQPAAPSCGDVLALRPNLNSLYWNIVRGRTHLSLELGRGRWMTCVANMAAGADLLAALRGPQPLCMDLADNPAAVRAACDHLASFFPMMFEDAWAPIRQAGQPCAAWTPLLHTGPAYPVACDFLSMVSPRMAAETILPSLERQTAMLERSLFHLDGPRSIFHLDALLALPRLDAVQWDYGPGNGPAARWVDVYKKIQAAGKAVQLLCEDLDDARAVAAHLRPEGVWFCPAGTYARGEAEAFIAWTARWAAKKQAAAHPGPAMPAPRPPTVG
jgi:hypothetical protein